MPRPCLGAPIVILLPLSCRRLTVLLPCFDSLPAIPCPLFLPPGAFLPPGCCPSPKRAYGGLDPASPLNRAISNRRPMIVTRWRWLERIRARIKLFSVPQVDLRLAAPGAPSIDRHAEPSVCTKDRRIHSSALTCNQPLDLLVVAARIIHSARHAVDFAS